MSTLLVRADKMEKESMYYNGGVSFVNNNKVKNSKWVKIDGQWWVYSKDKEEIELDWAGCEYMEYDFEAAAENYNKKCIDNSKKYIDKIDMNWEAQSEKQLNFAKDLLLKKLGMLMDYFISTKYPNLDKVLEVYNNLLKKMTAKDVIEHLIDKNNGYDIYIDVCYKIEEENKKNKKEVN